MHWWIGAQGDRAGGNGGWTGAELGARLVAKGSWGGTQAPPWGGSEELEKMEAAPKHVL